jgi:hypothetical protein
MSSAAPVLPKESKMKRRWLWIGLIAGAVVLAAGGVYYTRGQQTGATQARPRDPWLTVLFAIRTLERSDDTRLSKEQIVQILPFVKALKDVPASDDAGIVIARAIRDTFTPEQKAALEAARQQFQSRSQQPQGGPPGGLGGGEGGAPSAGPAGAGGPQGSGGSDEQRAQFRSRAFERMIRYLERRMK